MTLGKSNQLGKYSFGSLHNLHVTIMRTSCFDNSLNSLFRETDFSDPQRYMEIIGQNDRMTAVVAAL